MPNTSPRLVAGGDITPSRFVMLDASADGDAPAGSDVGLIAANGSTPIGISMEGTNYPPLEDVAPNPHLAAKIGQYFKLYGQGDECMLYAAAAAGINPGVRVKPDATGTGGAIAAANGDASGAICLERPIADGELFRVQVDLNPAAA